MNCAERFLTHKYCELDDQRAIHLQKINDEDASGIGAGYWSVWSCRTSIVHLMDVLLNNEVFNVLRKGVVIAEKLFRFKGLGLNQWWKLK
jgi:hypothetical protein